MYLTGLSTKHHYQFQHWIKVVREDLKCDERACRAFAQLFSMNPPGAPHGFQEANRVLAHVLKDKMKKSEDLVERHKDRDWSAFMSKACLESIEALENWQHVKDLKKEKQGVRGSL